MPKWPKVTIDSSLCSVPLEGADQILQSKENTPRETGRSPLQFWTSLSMSKRHPIFILVLTCLDSRKTWNSLISGEMKHALLDGDVTTYDLVCFALIARWFFWRQCGVCFLSSGSRLYKASYRWFTQYLRQARWTFDHKPCETSPMGQRHTVNLALITVGLRWDWMQLFISVPTRIMSKCPSMILPGRVWWTTGPICVDRGRSFTLHLSSLRRCRDPCNSLHWTDSF